MSQPTLLQTLDRKACKAFGLVNAVLATLVGESPVHASVCAQVGYTDAKRKLAEALVPTIARY